MQFRADVTGWPVVGPAMVETTALGAAYLAGLAVGFWQVLNSIATHWRIENLPSPVAARPRDRIA